MKSGAEPQGHRFRHEKVQVDGPHSRNAVRTIARGDGNALINRRDRLKA